MKNDTRELVVGEFDSTSNNKVMARILVDNVTGQSVIDFRLVFTRDNNDTPIFTKKGFRVDIENFDKFLEIAKKVDIAVQINKENEK